MVTHIVVFTWLPGATAAQVENLGQALTALAAQMRGNAVIRHGADLGFRDGNGDYALVATFADRDDWDSYQADPRHKAFVRDHVTPIQAARLTVQFHHDD